MKGKKLEKGGGGSKANRRRGGRMQEQSAQTISYRTIKDPQWEAEKTESGSRSRALAGDEGWPQSKTATCVEKDAQEPGRGSEEVVERSSERSEGS